MILQEGDVFFASQEPAEERGLVVGGGGLAQGDAAVPGRGRTGGFGGDRKTFQLAR
jgi:hypothetical protein